MEKINLFDINSIPEKFISVKGKFNIYSKTLFIVEFEGKKVNSNVCIEQIDDILLSLNRELYHKSDFVIHFNSFGATEEISIMQFNTNTCMYFGWVDNTIPESVFKMLLETMVSKTAELLDIIGRVYYSKMDYSYQFGSEFG